MIVYLVATRRWAGENMTGMELHPLWPSSRCGQFFHNPTDYGRGLALVLVEGKEGQAIV